MCGCWSRIYIFSTKSTYVFINFIDYSRYIYYFSKPWGCFVYMYVCNYINFYECFLSLEAVCVFDCMHLDVCELGTLGCVGRVG